MEDGWMDGWVGGWVGREREREGVLEFLSSFGKVLLLAFCCSSFEWSGHGRLFVRGDIFLEAFGTGECMLIVFERKKRCFLRHE